MPSNRTRTVSAGTPASASKPAAKSSRVVVEAAGKRTRHAVPGRTIATYQARRDFQVTAEPAPDKAARSSGKGAPGKSVAPIFVVQKHDASRLHWDFRLEHGGVLWSWAVPRGPSLDPHDKRLAVHVEDHPLDYADFHGTIPEGQYGAGTVETWDRGTWEPMGDPDADLARGELKFLLRGSRLNGHFVLVRLKPRPKERAENWLLIKEHDDQERANADALTLESERAGPKPTGPERVYAEPTGKAALAKKIKAGKARKVTEDDRPPAAGAVPSKGLPDRQPPQLATLVEQAPDDDGWLSEVKFDGYRMLAFIDGANVRMITRNGLDWTNRMQPVAAALGRLALENAVIDGELVALRADGVSNFADLQQALSNGRPKALSYFAFDLLHLNGWDVRPCRLVDRKALLHGLGDWRGVLRYSDHIANDAGRMRRAACEMGLEGIICKQADAPYRGGRGRTWVKAKCQNREEFAVIGFTPPAGSRENLGALQLGYFDAQARLHYAGAVGTGFTEQDLATLRRQLQPLEIKRPAALLFSGDPIDRATIWVRPQLVAEVQYLTWTGAGRLRHAAFLGLREDKRAEEIVRDIPDPEAPRQELGKPAATRIVTAARPTQSKTTKSSTTKSKPPRAGSAAKEAAKDKPAITRAPAHSDHEEIGGVRVSHPDRAFWPGITKHDLAEYWRSVAPHALPAIAGRPLALVRCPEGFAGEHFFQKHGKPGFPVQIRAAEAGGAPYLVIDDEAGLIAAAQVAALEVHVWGASGQDPLRPDQLVFDLDPGEGVDMAAIVAAAHDVRERLKRAGLAAFCRTSGGKGLHVVAPLVAKAGWDEARAWARAFAETMERESPDRYVASVPKARRKGRILVDWLRNGLGSTAIASFSPRAREGAGVATPLEWGEVNDDLAPAAFNIRTVPERLAQQKRDPWRDFTKSAKALPPPSPTRSRK